MKLINNDIYLLLIDEEVEIKGTVCLCYNSIKNTWNEDIILYQDTMPDYHYTGFQKIIAYRKLTKEAKELDLPLLPDPFENKFNVTEWAKEEHKFNHKSIHELFHELSFILGCEVGYQKVQSKQYSLEDIKKAFEEGSKHKYVCEANGKDKKCYCRNDNECNLRHYMTAEEFIQSISTQQLPKEFKPIMVCGRCLKPDDNDEDCWSAKECSRNTDFPDTFKTIINSKNKQELIETYKY